MLPFNIQMKWLEPPPHVLESLPQSLPGIAGEQGQILLPSTSPGCSLPDHDIQLNRCQPLPPAYFYAMLDISKPSFPPKEGERITNPELLWITWFEKSWGNGSWPGSQMVRAAVPNFFGTRNRFCGRHFSSERGWAGTETGGGTQGVMPAKLCSLTCHSPPVPNRPQTGTSPWPRGWGPLG